MFGHKAPSYSTVKNWFNKFNRGRHSLKDEVRKGRPKTADVSENIDTVREQIMQDRHVTYHEIEASLVISSTSIHSILHEPGRKKLLFSLNHAIAQKRLVSIGEKNCWKNTIAVLQKLFMKKALQIVACFFGKTDHVTTVSLEQRTSVNSEWYTTMCLPEVFGEIRKRNKRRRINVHHGNASSHISTQTSGERRIHGSSAVQSCLDTQ